MNSTSTRGFGARARRNPFESETAVASYSQGASNTRRRQPNVPQSYNEGGVRIPSYAETQVAENRRRVRFHEESLNRIKQVLETRKAEDEKKVDEIKQVLKAEIQRYEKLQTQLNENIEKAKKMLLADAKKVDKGAYHVTIAEVLLMALRNAITDIANSNNWLEAMITRKKKRGSLFAARSKNQGTQYSMSQELSLARSSG